MASRLCRVSLTDADGVKHSVEVSAASLMEAAALGLAAMKGESWVAGPARGAALEVVVMEPVLKHTVSVERVIRWLDGVTTSPSELLKKERLKTMLR